MCTQNLMYEPPAGDLEPQAVGVSLGTLQLEGHRTHHPHTQDDQGQGEGKGTSSVQE